MLWNDSRKIKLLAVLFYLVIILWKSLLLSYFVIKKTFCFFVHFPGISAYGYSCAHLNSLNGISESRNVKRKGVWKIHVSILQDCALSRNKLQDNFSSMSVYMITPQRTFKRTTKTPLLTIFFLLLPLVLFFPFSLPFPLYYFSLHFWNI